MPGDDFEIVDNDKRTLARHSLGRLKALAPTFPEGSPRRLACMELIAEREQALGLEAQRTALRRSNIAVAISVAAFVLPPAAFVSWIFLKPPEPVAQRAVVPERKSPAVVRPVARPSPSPSPVEAPPLPESLSVPPVTE